ncbi:MAG TPA: hypothetical protein VJ508_06070 [Saprospiraceae bacterium]|nr:hypothetical protein [Saprospiraceae bacterium]
MQRPLLTILFYGSFIFSGLIMIMSMGWFLGLFGILLLPSMIIHILGGSRALRWTPLLNKWVFLSSFMMLAFALIRPDMDDTRSYTGWSSLQYNLGFRSSQYTQVPDWTWWAGIVLLVAMLIIDIIMLRKGKKPPPVPESNEYV